MAPQQILFFVGGVFWLEWYLPQIGGTYLREIPLESKIAVDKKKLCYQLMFAITNILKAGLEIITFFNNKLVLACSLIKRRLVLWKQLVIVKIQLYYFNPWLNIVTNSHVMWKQQHHIYLKYLPSFSIHFCHLKGKIIYALAMELWESGLYKIYKGIYLKTEKVIPLAVADHILTFYGL